jgi:hypothetical protein
MKHKVRRGGKGRARRFAWEDLQVLVARQPAVKPLFEFWASLRRQVEGGSGCVVVEDRPYEGDGLFWQADGDRLFLFSPQRVVRALRREI